MNRRELLKSAGAATLGLTVAQHLRAQTNSQAVHQTLDQSRPTEKWDAIRQEFDRIDRSFVHMAGFLLASHPRTVRQSIEGHAQSFDKNPAHYLYDEVLLREEAVREAAAKYFGGDKTQYGLTTSTTMGAALVYNGIKIRPDQEILYSIHDHFTSRGCISNRAKKNGFSEKSITLYEDPFKVTKKQIVERIEKNITSKTRVLVVTWVHSGAGVKMPVKEISQVVEQANIGRSLEDKLLLCVDGVHGTGIENVQLSDLGCDFFYAGTHKWICGPRGTGILWGKPEMHNELLSTIPSMFGSATFGMRMTPGGFQSYEYRYAAKEAFEFHLSIGKDNVQNRIHALNLRLKEGLLKIPGVTLYTPLDSELSSGFVSFDIPGKTPKQIIDGLKEQKVIASSTQYDRVYIRFAAGLLNNETDVDATIAATKVIASI